MSYNTHDPSQGGYGYAPYPTMGAYPQQYPQPGSPMGYPGPQSYGYPPPTEGVSYPQPDYSGAGYSPADYYRTGGYPGGYPAKSQPKPPKSPSGLSLALSASSVADIANIGAIVLALILLVYSCCTKEFGVGDAFLCSLSFVAAFGALWSLISKKTESNPIVFAAALAGGVTNVLNIVTFDKNSNHVKTPTFFVVCTVIAVLQAVVSILLLVGGDKKIGEFLSSPAPEAGAYPAPAPAGSYPNNQQQAYAGASTQQVYQPAVQYGDSANLPGSPTNYYSSAEESARTNGSSAEARSYSLGEENPQHHTPSSS